MNKDSDINKEEPLLENVSFVSSSKEDQRASIDISKRWITLIICLLLLSTIVGCVGLTIGFKRIERQDMKNFEEILKIVSKTKHDDINTESTRNETVKDLAEHPRVRTKRSSTVRHLYCPTGGTKSLPLYDSEIAEGHDTVMRRFDEHCQCKHGATCWKQHSRPEFGCSTDFGKFLENDLYVKSACYIHDMCYESGRSKSLCDNEFRHNFKQLCYTPVATGLSVAAGVAAAPVAGTVAACAIPFINLIACPIAVATLPATAVAGVTTGAQMAVATAALTNCESLGDIAYYAVRDWGDIRGYQCKTHKVKGDKRCP